MDTSGPRTEAWKECQRLERLTGPIRLRILKQLLAEHSGDPVSLHSEELSDVVTGYTNVEMADYLQTTPVQSIGQALKIKLYLAFYSLTGQHFIKGIRDHIMYVRSQA